VQSVVDLLREGRASLATSFASYKFLIIYGQTFSVIKSICYYFGVLMSPMGYVAIDGIAVILLSYLLTLSEPRKRLRKERPSSSLLSGVTIASVCGLHTLNVTIVAVCLGMATSHAQYKQFPARYATWESWWTLSDNWESTIVFTCAFPQFITAGLIYSFGGQFRRGLRHNYVLIVVWLCLFVLNTVVLLTEHNPVTQAFHIASEDFNGPGTPYQVWYDYQREGGKPSEGMPFQLRLSLWLMTSTGLVLAALWEWVFIVGPGRRLLFPRRNVTHPDLRS